MCAGAIAGCAISCCSMCACNVCCRLGNVRSVGVKILYAFMLLFASLISLAMLGTGMQRWLSEQLSSFWFSDQAGSGALVGNDLVGTLAVTRVMSATVAFHLLFALLVCGVQTSKDPRAQFHNGLWPFKFLGLLALMVFMFFLPNELFVGLSSSIYRVGGGLYIIIQLIFFLGCLIHFYDGIFNSHIKIEGEDRGWMYAIAALTLLAYAWVIVAVVVTIVIHAGGDGCAEGLVGSFVGLIGCVVVSLLSLSPYASAPSSTTIVAGSINIYCVRP